MEKSNNTKVIVEAGICIALAKILSFIKFFEMPFGGSITLVSMLPLIVFSTRWGWKKGILVSAVYGLVDMMIGGYIIYPQQAIVDYILAYSMMGLSGIKFGNGNKLKNYIPSIVLAYFFRGVFSVISGFLFWYDMEVAQAAGFKVFWTYNLAYNYSYLIVDMIIVIVVYSLIFNRLKKLLNRK
ncbi:MAG: energy-coupled thiamine transporter ThiT [Peptoniphilaceae bacterium]|nr:energy-coupled thiamine transporter ThiT [Peptoniphilaceae bacterium]MDD7382757.1 energy-coupled thiamine transporter ThiT [Peptoniphilaceae bacterium]MDY3737913.1 energy-coupled thiamine transporter ThiT [Peptoniphilaceae bacterium]